MVNKTPKFSIITNSYNQSKFVAYCIESIICQNRELFEYILVDPGSTDGSRKIINSYSKNIDRIYLNPDSGPAEGLNNGFKCSSGEYIIFINADDFLLPNAIVKISKLLQQYKNPKILMCSGWMVDENCLPLRRLYTTRSDIKDFTENKGLMFQQGMVIRRDVFMEIGGFNEKNYTCWDYELLVNLLLKDIKPTVNMTRVAAFRIHKESITGKNKNLKNNKKYLADLNRIHNYSNEINSLKNDRLSRIFGRIKKFITTPEILPFTIYDRIAKNHLKNLFEKDSSFD